MNREYYLGLTLILFLTSCQDCFKSTGSTTTNIRELPAFSALVVEDNLDVILKKSDRTYVEVRAGENLLSNIKTNVSDGVLTVENKVACNWVRNQNRDFIVTVHYTDLDKVVHLGYGNISASETLIFDDLTLQVFGVGDFILPLKVENLNCDLRRLGNFHLEGEVQNLNIFTFDSGFFYGKNLIAKNCSATNAGEQDFEITVTDTLNAHIGRLGNITYYGNPIFISETRDERLATGSLIKGD